MDNAEQLRQLTAAVNRLNELLAAGVPGTVSTAPEIILSLVPVMGIVFGCVLLFFFFLWQYKIRKELIRSGQHQPMFVTNIRMLSLLIGLLGVSSGLPMTFLFLLIEGVTYALLGGLLPLFAGIGFIIFYGMTRTRTRSDS